MEDGVGASVQLDSILDQLGGAQDVIGGGGCRIGMKGTWIESGQKRLRRSDSCWRWNWRMN